MAQKKLLFYVILALIGGWFLTYSYSAVASNLVDAQGLVERSRKFSIQAIKEKYLELQEMLRGWGDESNGQPVASMFDETADLRVFVSSSMSKELLKSYVAEAKKYKAVLVFNGLPNGSWRELANIVSEIAGSDDEVGIQIDDEAFKRFGIKTVPSFVLSLSSRDEWMNEEGSKADIFDKASGNIGIGGFLRLVADQGELAQEARRILK